MVALKCVLLYLGDVATSTNQPLTDFQLDVTETSDFERSGLDVSSDDQHMMSDDLVSMTDDVIMESLAETDASSSQSNGYATRHLVIRL